MYKDAKEELKRLEEALLEEEEIRTEESEEDLDALLQQAKELLEEPSDETQVFHWQPEELKKAGRVYNTDKTDEDLERFSEAVRSGEKKSLTGLIITAAALAAGIVAVLIWWIVRYGGAFL